MSVTKDKLKLVYEVEADILQHSRLTKLSYRRDGSYFGGRAGLIRILTLIFGTLSVGFMWTGYHPRKLNSTDDQDAEYIRMMNSDEFSGYIVSKMTLASIAFGGCAAGLSLIYVFLLYLFMEVRCDLLWEKVNQKTQVLCCILSLTAAFCDVLSIQVIQEKNCGSEKCELDTHKTKNTKFAEEFYPPYFLYHYCSFVLFLTNAMLFSIASRIWLRNED